MLLISALLKFYDAYFSFPLTNQRWTAVLVAGEWMLGAWLLSGLARRAAWGAALLAFSAFAVYNVWQGLSGAASCDCFGALKVNPWYTAALDGCIVAGLILYRPERSLPTVHERYSRKLALALIVAMLIGLPIGLGISGAFRAPSQHGLVSDEPSHDFGTLTLAQAGAAEHVFTLRNTTDRPIRISKQSSTCGCTVAEPPSEPIPGGGTARVRIKADWANKPGRRMEEVQLVTDDAAAPPIALAISGDVRASASLSPTTIHFAAIAPGETVKRNVRVGGTSGKDLRITAIEKSTNLLTVTRISDAGHPDDALPLAGVPGIFQVLG